MIEIIATALILLGGELVAPVEFAAILEGEAGVCGVEAMATVASVYQNNPRMNGQKTPRRWALWTALNWQGITTKSGNSGQFLFSGDDLARPSVIALKRGLEVLDVFKCAGGGWLFVYGNML